jgi:hypothetical protein
MLHARAKAMLPHKSFDIDGDGAVRTGFIRIVASYI